MIEQADRGADRDRSHAVRTLLEDRDHVAADKDLLEDGIDDQDDDERGETESAWRRPRGGEGLPGCRRDDLHRQEYLPRGEQGEGGETKPDQRLDGAETDAEPLERPAADAQECEQRGADRHFIDNESEQVAA